MHLGSIGAAEAEVQVGLLGQHSRRDEGEIETVGIPDDQDAVLALLGGSGGEAEMVS